MGFYDDRVIELLTSQPKEGVSHYERKDATRYLQAGDGSDESRPETSSSSWTLLADVLSDSGSQDGVPLSPDGFAQIAVLKID